MDMRRLSFVIALIVAVTFATGRSSSAQNISYFADGTYGDTTPGQEVDNLRASLVANGFTVTDFTGITAADFTAATSSGQILVFPEMELRDLFSDLSAAAIAVLQGYVNTGGSIVQANYFVGNSSLPNGLFGFSLSQLGNIGDTFLDAGAATGTAFAGGPGTAPGSNAVEGVSGASLPGSALNIYHDGDVTSVFTTKIQDGCYTYLGFDWFETPTPADWTTIVGNAVRQCGQGPTVPEPGSLALFGSVSFAGLGMLLRRRGRK